eukprot:1139707-Rhodomonas_salina.2
MYHKRGVPPLITCTAPAELYQISDGTAWYGQEGAAVFEEASFGSETSLSVTSPEGLERGPYQLALALDGQHGVFEECGTAFTVV